jgi:conjugative relaxase-like TrwC/TraI family protein
MQTTHKISGDSAVGYATYVTSTSQRGDYYAGEGEGDGSTTTTLSPSRWHGSPHLLAELGLRIDGPVERDDLISLMRGVSPADGRELRRAGGDGSRVAAIDLTFSAPKSVSALWAVSSPYERARIEAAHGHAVAGTITRIERDVELLRTRVNGELRWERAASMLAAEFVHTSSRLTRDQESDGVPDPQLHSHVLVLGAERTNGPFAAVDSRELFRSARANGAFYRAELAHGLRELGLEIHGRTGRDGRYFELAGVPTALSERWSMRGVEIERAARAFRTRYGRDPRAGELGSLTLATRGTKAKLTAVNVDQAWRAVGEEYGLTRQRAQDLYSNSLDHDADVGRDLARSVLADVTKERSTVSQRDLRARAYELAAGVCGARAADDVVRSLVASGDLVALQGDVWTTKELRDREKEMLAIACSRSTEQAAPVGESALRAARAQLERDSGVSLSAEQRRALQTITGPGGVTVLVGQAGTGKGVVVATAVDAWRREGYQVIGTAVAGATAKRLEADARLERSLTADALLSRVQNGSVALHARTVVVMDEAGMADTNRLATLTTLTTRSQAKLVLVGDHAQLPSIGAGGMFAALQEKVPTAEVSEVHRARHAWERQAWRQVRTGEAEHALAGYRSHGRLHISDTRVEAAERMVDDWDATRRANPERRTVMLTDASNAELDRINALAQEHRARAGELGARTVDLPNRPYGLAAGDEVIFTAALKQPGHARVENGTLGTVADVTGEGAVSIKTRSPAARDVQFEPTNFAELRLAYAQHVYKAQGRTVDRAFVLTGGWQTNLEHGYVALTRARERTDIYVSLEDLGEQGMDAGAIERLGEAIAESHAQEASIATPLARERAGEVVQLMRDSREREQDLGRGVE